MSHRYRVGQVLEMRSSPKISNRVAGPVEVIFCLPHDQGPSLYRVKPLNENVERVVAEADLAPSSATRPTVEAAVRPITIAIARR
ncbi:MAG: hypothetical protein BGO83_18510 [Devosia sp. 66-14]|jgi:hypothetical protein|nr:MAG: hypothetical protein BGO83_18510 [Devosia sp. 66-14]